MSYKVGMISLGCPKNRISAEVMLARLRDGGFELTSEAEEADVVVINTCGFIEDAKREAIDAIFDCVRMKESGQIRSIVVTGCLAERYRTDILSEIPEVDAVVSIGADGDIADICRRSLTEGHIFADGEKCASLLNGDRILTTPGYFAYLKVSDGCNNRCAYCAIPLIRGDQRSRTMEDIVSEAEGLAASGVKELIVVAQDTTRYGSDVYGRCMLPELLERLCAVEGVEWIRVMYCYPERVTDRLLDVMAKNDKIVKYIDLPVQHCSPDVLRRMRRTGGRAELLSLLAHMRERVPELVIRTTVMVGFPGESEEEFGELEEFIDEARFDRLGCFAFSPEEDTPAAEMDGQIDDEVKLRRREAIMLRQLEVTESKLEAMTGRRLKVLVEGYDGEREMYYGRSYMDAPDIDGRVYFKSGGKAASGDFVCVSVTGHTDYDLIGKEVGM